MHNRRSNKGDTELTLKKKPKTKHRPITSREGGERKNKKNISRLLRHEDLSTSSRTCKRREPRRVFSISPTFSKSRPIFRALYVYIGCFEVAVGADLRDGHFDGSGRQRKEQRLPWRKKELWRYGAAGEFFCAFELWESCGCRADGHFQILYIMGLLRVLEFHFITRDRVSMLYFDLVGYYLMRVNVLADTS